MDDDLTASLRRAARAADPSAALAALSGDVEQRSLLWALASLQDGQFATRQARVVGLTAHAIRWLGTSGRTTSIARGVHRVTGAPGAPDPAVTAFLRCWPAGVVGYATAAHHHGLIRTAPVVPEIVVPRCSYRVLPGVVVHQSRALPRDDRHLVGGVVYTSLARTVCDLATTDDRSGTLARLDDAVAAGASPRWLHRRARALTDGRDGVALVRDATAPGTPAFRSWLERCTATLFHRAGLPAPSWNVAVSDHRGTIGIVDALWVPLRVVVEIEGLRFHTSPQARRSDAARFNRLLAAGFAVRRFTWRDVVDEPHRTAVATAEALRDAGAAVDPGTVPTELVLPRR